MTELRGKIKVVTNNRAVHTFADLSAGSYSFIPQKELPSGLGEGGLVSICLEPKHGYVFGTFLYLDSQGVMRNTIIDCFSDLHPAQQQVVALRRLL